MDDREEEGLGKRVGSLAGYQTTQRVAGGALQTSRIGAPSDAKSDSFSAPSDPYAALRCLSGSRRASFGVSSGATEPPAVSLPPKDLEEQTRLR